MSHAVIVGFTLGASVLLVLDQLKNLLGIPAAGTGEDHFLKRFWLTMQHIDKTNYPSLWIGLGTVAIALALRWVNMRMGLRLPELLLALICMTVVVANWRLDSQGVKIIKDIPAQLPSFELPVVDWKHVHTLGSSALAVAMLGLLEAISMAKAIAATTRQKLDINQQCLSEGVANVVGKFVSLLSGLGVADAVDDQSCSRAGERSGRG